MNIHQPDRFVIFKLKNDNGFLYKVLGGWIGGYLGGSSWRLNSGITKVEVDGDCYLFYGHSGSIYKCHKDLYGLTLLMSNVAYSIKDRGGEMLEDQDFTNLLGEKKTEEENPSKKEAK
jgi:hypothetical protein